MSADWLPDLILLDDHGGNWDDYLEKLYQHFTVDFIHSKPSWPGKRVNLKRHPVEKGKEATFWHFISDGENENERIPDLRRCERIRWPRPTMEAFIERQPTDSDRIVWWKNRRRGNEWRYLLALPDFSYLVVVADRGEYVLPWTQYCVEQLNRREKYRKEYNAYWNAQKS